VKTVFSIFVKRILTVLAVWFFLSVAVSAGEDTCATFGKWRISAGGAYNGGLRARLQTRNIPGFGSSPYAGGPLLTREQAIANAEGRDGVYRFDGGGLIEDDDLHNGWTTEKWQLPSSAYRYDPVAGNGHFELENTYYEGSSAASQGGLEGHDECQFGLSFEIARELWLHNENDEHRWGFDFVMGLSYFFQRDIYASRGTLRKGTITTDITDHSAMAEYDEEYDPDYVGMYGHYNGHAGYGGSPALRWESIGHWSDGLVATPCGGYRASGDYRELEFLFMIRPWFEITDWWRVYGQVGVGVSWGEFDIDFYGDSWRAHEDFDRWNVYGVAGIGTCFRFGQVDLSVDFMGRFLRDDFEVDGKHISGSIEQSDWGFRVMLGFEF